MKKVFILLFIFGIFLTFGIRTDAFTADPNSGEYTQDTTLTLELKAKPQGNENAVSIDLLAEGLTITNYTPPSSSDWIGNTSDCSNGQLYSSDRVCTSMAKSSKIEDGESLGTITVQIKGSTYGKITKGSNNLYSDSTNLRNDLGTLAEFNKTFQNNNSSSQLLNIQISENLQPILIALTLAFIVILLVLMFLPKIKTVLSSRNGENPGPF